MDEPQVDRWLRAVVCAALSAVASLLFHLLLVVQSAPTGFTGLTAASQRASTLLEKILNDVPALHAATVHIQVSLTSLLSPCPPPRLRLQTHD